MAAGRAFDVDAFLERPPVARVATNGPTVRPVWFIWEEGCLWWLTGPWSRLGDHLSRDPRLYVVIDTCDLATGEVRQVRMVGDGRVVAYDHARARRKLRRYLGSDEAAWDERFALDPDDRESRFVVLRPDRLEAVDHSFEPSLRAQAGARPGGGGRLVVVCGLPGAGKTTHATRLARERDAVRLNADEWMERLDVNRWEAEVRDRMEQLQWDLAQQLLRGGHEVVIEWGTWSRIERDSLRERARQLGAMVELHHLSAPHEVRFARLEERGAEAPPITEEQLREWAEVFEPPDEEEGAEWDRFETRTELEEAEP